MNKYLNNNELIIIALCGISVGAFMTEQYDIASAIATGLIGFLGGMAQK